MIHRMGKTFGVRRCHYRPGPAPDSLRTLGFRLPPCKGARPSRSCLPGSKHWRKEEQRFINASPMGQLKQLTAQSSTQSGPDPLPSLFLPLPPLHPHPNRSSDLCLGWAPGHFPGGEFPRALGGSPRRIQDTAAGNVERIFKSEGEAMSLCQISGLDPGLRNGGAFPLADSRCSSRCGYGNKINDG